jgi:Domain of unknown function (DUF4406)
MLLVYVAGPYRAPSEWEVLNNIRRAEDIALRVWKAGVACICPHKNTAFFGGAAPDEMWLTGDLEMVRRSDAVVCVPGWERSVGASGEVACAREFGIPVFVTFEEFERWLNASPDPERNSNGSSPKQRPTISPSP